MLFDAIINSLLMKCFLTEFYKNIAEIFKKDMVYIIKMSYIHIIKNTLIKYGY